MKTGLSLAATLLLLTAAPALAQQRETPQGRARPAAQRPPAPAADPGPVNAFLNAPPVMGLAEAERRLVARNLMVVAAQRGVDAARAQSLIAGSLPPAALSLGNTFGQVNERGGGGGMQGWRFLSPSNNLNLGLTGLIEIGGKRELRSRAASAQLNAAEAQVLDTLRGQVFQLRQAFIQGLAARANLEVALGNRASLDRTEALLRQQVRLGAIPEGDLIRFQASRLSFEQDVTTNAQAYAASIAALALLMADDAANFAPARQRAGSPVAFDLQGRLEASQTLGVTRDALAAATATRPDVVVAERMAAAMVANRDLAEAGRYRDVSVGLGLSRTRLTQNVPGDFQANDQALLQFSVPIFNGRIVEGNIGVATAQAAQAEAMARAAALQARADFAVAWAALEQTRALRSLYDSGALRRAEEAYEIAERAYLAGGRSLIDTLDALRTLNATRIQANQARAAYLLALAQLEQATGVTGILPQF